MWPLKFNVTFTSLSKVYRESISKVFGISNVTVAWAQSHFAIAINDAIHTLAVDNEIVCDVCVAIVGLSRVTIAVRKGNLNILLDA